MQSSDFENLSSEELRELLTPKQRSFVEKLLEGLSQHDAAVAAGYSPKTADGQASQLLKNPKVAAYRRARSIELYHELGVTPEWVGTRLVEVVERCMAAHPHMVWDRDLHDYVEDGFWIFDAKGATTALKAIGESLGMFKAPGTKESGGGAAQVTFVFPGGEGEEFGK